jgi:hypothetical protein
MSDFASSSNSPRSSEAEPLDEVVVEPLVQEAAPQVIRQSPAFESIPIAPHKPEEDRLNELSLSGDDQLSIAVRDHEVRDSLLKRYVVYVIQVTSKQGSGAYGAFQSSRRYSDFATLRSRLVSNWPAIYIPPVPSKKAIVRVT